MRKPRKRNRNLLLTIIFFKLFRLIPWPFQHFSYLCRWKSRESSRWQLLRPLLYRNQLQHYRQFVLLLTVGYYTVPELELNHGFCDFFLLPDLTHYATKHSYILKLKVLPKNASVDEAEKQWLEAVEQIRRYAVAPRVEALRQGT